MRYKVAVKVQMAFHRKHAQRSSSLRNIYITLFIIMLLLIASVVGGSQHFSDYVFIRLTA